MSYPDAAAWSAPGMRPRRGRSRRALDALLHGPALGDSLRRWALWAAFRAGVMAAVAAGVVRTMGLLYGHQLSYLQLVTVFAAVLLVPWTLHLMQAPPAPESPPDPSRFSLPERPFPRADRWERRLSTTRDDAEWFERVVRDRLVPVVGERLRQRHGVSLRRDPQRARELLGEALHTFLTEPLPRPPTPSELARYLTRVEEI